MSVHRDTVYSTSDISSFECLLFVLTADIKNEDISGLFMMTLPYMVWYYKDGVMFLSI